MSFELDITKCPYCQGALVHKYIEHQRRLVCAKCHRIIYHNPVPVVAAVVIKGGKILLGKRKNLPNIGAWNLPAGFLEIEEQPEEGVLRELKEETGLNGKFPVLCCAVTQKSKRYGSIVALGFVVPFVEGTIKAGDDASEVKYFPLNDMPSIPFSSHRTIIKRAVAYIYETLNR